MNKIIRLCKRVPPYCFSQGGISSSAAHDILKHPKVELHVHLDGSIRTETILHHAKKRNIALPAYDVNSLNKHVCVTKCQNLTHFLETFNIITPVIAGSEDAIEQVAFEFCEDSAKQGIIYSEVRYCPHLLADLLWSPIYKQCSQVTPSNVVDYVNRGLKRGMDEFGIVVKSILCCLRHKPEWSDQILELCLKHQHNGVVGIDLAGDERKFANPTHPEHIRVFKVAAKYGVHRTVHAGENGHWHNILEALEVMEANRIGHGYHVIDDLGFYKMAIHSHVHFEVCPLSSYATGSVDCSPEDHPITKITYDGGNLSISTDDPAIFQSSMNDDYMFSIEKMRLQPRHIIQSNFNAIDASFTHDDMERQEIKNKLITSYGYLKDRI